MKPPWPKCLHFPFAAHTCLANIYSTPRCSTAFAAGSHLSATQPAQADASLLILLSHTRHSPTTV